MVIKKEGNNYTQRITIVGAGLVGVAYALFLKNEGFDVELYEKRDESEIDNLSSVIYLKSPAMVQLMPYIKEIFNSGHPKAFQSYRWKNLFTNDYHSNIKISDLLHALISKAKEMEIPIYRGRQFDSVRIDKDTGEKFARFIRDHDESIIEEIPYEQLLLAVGNKEIKPILEKANVKKPLELHYMNTLVCRIEDDFSGIDVHKQPITAVYPDIQSKFSYSWMQVNARLNRSVASAGRMTMYFVTAKDINFLTTYSPEQRDEFANNKVARAKYMKDAIAQLVNGISAQDKKADFSWLPKTIEKVDSNDAHPVTAIASLLIPNVALFKQGIMPIGDAFIAAPYIWGSEYNNHIAIIFPVILKTLKKLETAHSEEEKMVIYNQFEEALWEVINNKHVKSFFEMAEPLGNSILPDGTRVNPVNGYKFNRSTLEKMQQKDWVDIPEYQKGGFLTLPDEKSSLQQFGLMTNLNMENKKPEQDAQCKTSKINAKI
ncbi:MAG: hypothetical protein ACD_46C00642G0002 [uncultured bacterium]|nr:MAG: hypothetical protein ACD_46C00642G0002 [uncultured bacterium]